MTCRQVHGELCKVVMCSTIIRCLEDSLSSYSLFRSSSAHAAVAFAVATAGSSNPRDLPTTVQSGHIRAKLWSFLCRKDQMIPFVKLPNGRCQLRAALPPWECCQFFDTGWLNTDRILSVIFIWKTCQLSSSKTLSAHPPYFRQSIKLRLNFSGKKFWTY